MTIKEFLRRQIECWSSVGPYGFAWADGERTGKIEAFQKILEMLPSFEHEITVKEVKDFCEKRGEHEHTPCEMYCSIYNECPYYSNFPPCLINIEQLKSDMARGDTYEEEYWNDKED